MKQPNRIAALSGSAGAVIAVLLAVLGAVDTTPKAIVVAVAIVVIGALVAVFLIGSQKWEALIFRQATGTPDQSLEITAPPGRLPDASTVAAALGDVAQTGPRSDPEHELTQASREWIADSPAARAAAAMGTDESLNGAFLAEATPEDAAGLKEDPR